MEASRRAILGTLASAIAGGKSAVNAVAAELGSATAAGAMALGQGDKLQYPAVNPVPYGYTGDQNWRAVRKLENYFEAMHGGRGPLTNPAVDAIKSYSPWYRAHRKASAATEPEETSATMALVRELRRVLP